MTLSEAREILGVDEDTPYHGIRARYRALALDAHPDRGGGADQFQRLHEAYSIASCNVYAPAEKPRIQRCGVCGGSGRITTTRGFATVSKRCTICHGKGKA